MRSVGLRDGLVTVFSRHTTAAVRIQDLFLDGKRNEAAAAVPDALIDETCLIGPAARIKDRLQAWQTLARYHQVGTLLLADVTIDALRVVAEATQ